MKSHLSIAFLKKIKKNLLLSFRAVHSSAPHSAQILLKTLCLCAAPRLSQSAIPSSLLATLQLNDRHNRFTAPEKKKGAAS